MTTFREIESSTINVTNQIGPNETIEVQGSIASSTNKGGKLARYKQIEKELEYERKMRKDMDEAR